MYFISHVDERHLSMAADQELADDQLPAGETPIWIQPPRGATQVDILERVETMAAQYQDVMVLNRGFPGERDETAAAWCEKKGWKYHGALDIHGCEAECLVELQSDLHSEYITRGRNMLIILNK